MRTYAGGGGFNEKRTGAYKGEGGGGGSEIGDFTAYVLYGCPQNIMKCLRCKQITIVPEKNVATDKTCILRKV